MNRKVNRKQTMKKEKKTNGKRAHASRSTKKQKRAAACFLLPGLAGVSAFLLVPFGNVFLSSFRTSLTKQFVGLKNYLSIFQNSAFRLAAGNTARFIALGVPLLLLAGLGLALVINSTARWDKYKYLYLLPMAVPAATMVLVWQMLFERQGFLNRLLGMHTDFLGEGSAFYILVGSYLWKNLGYDIVLWMAGLSGISENIYEAARVDGAGEWQCFFKITLPNLRSSFYTITVLSFLNSFKVFREAYLVAGDYPHESIYMMQHLFNNWFRSFSFDKMAAAAVLESLVLLLLILLFQRALERRNDGKEC